MILFPFVALASALKPRQGRAGTPSFAAGTHITHQRYSTLLFLARAFDWPKHSPYFLYVLRFQLINVSFQLINLSGTFVLFTLLGRMACKCGHILLLESSDTLLYMTCEIKGDPSLKRLGWIQHATMAVLTDTKDIVSFHLCTFVYWWYKII